MVNLSMQVEGVESVGEAPIKIALRLFDTLERNRFLSLFKIIQMQSDIGFTLVDCDQANVVIIDPDEPGGERILSASSDNHAITAIAYTDAKHGGYTHAIEKPVKIKPLLSALQAIARTTEMAVERVKLRESNLANGMQDRDESFDPDIGLLGILRQRQTGFSRVELVGSGELLLDHQGGHYCSLLGAAKPLSKNATQALLSCEGALQSEISEGEFTSYIAQHRLECYSIESLLWSLTLFHSRGKPVRGLELNRAVQLKQWPKLTKLPHLPEHARLCALLIQYPSTIDSAVERTGIVREAVVAFFNACVVSGLLKYAEPAVQQQQQASPAPERKALLKKIVKRLFG